MPVMAERIRIAFDVPERIRRALNIEASRRGKSVGEVIEILVIHHCPVSIGVADEAILEGTPEGEVKRGRPRKSSDD